MTGREIKLPKSNIEEANRLLMTYGPNAAADYVFDKCFDAMAPVKQFPFFIAGSSRTGKSLTSKILRERGYDIVSMDSFRRYYLEGNKQAEHSQSAREAFYSRAQGTGGLGAGPIDLPLAA